jgi:hypothetical protein
LTLSITACETTPKIEYVHETPDVIFPVFPFSDSVTYDEETGTVSMPLWYWQKIAEYKIDVDAIEAYLSILQSLNDVGGMKSLAEKTKKKTDRLFDRKDAR